jgi:hypothetical protein
VRHQLRKKRSTLKRQETAIIRHPHCLSALVFSNILTLTACDKQSDIPDPMTNIAMMEEGVPVADVPLPPIIGKSRSYRCTDGSTVYVDFFADNRSANLRIRKRGRAVTLENAGDKGPYVSDGYWLSGNTRQATIALSGRGPQLCKSSIN